MSPSNLKYKSFLNPLLWLTLFLTQCNEVAEKNSQIFKYNQANGIASLDPAFAKDQATTWACNQLFDGLVRLDLKMQVTPAIADSWSISNNALDYTFYLNKEVFFHENICFGKQKNRRVNSYDFQYSFLRLLDPIVASPGAWIFKDRLNLKNPFTIIDSFQFIIHLDKPFGPFLQLLTMQYCSVIPKEAIQYYRTNFRRNPVGTGPFEFKRWEDGIALFLKKNEHYFLFDARGYRLPYLSGVKISFMEQKKIEYLSFMNHSLDFLNGLDISYINELLTEEGVLKAKFKEEIKFYKAPYLNTEYLGILQNSTNHKIHPLLKNKKIRQAINYGINRKELVTYLKNNIGKEANSGFVPNGLNSFDTNTVKGYHYNRLKAIQLIQEAGLIPSKYPPITIHVNNANQDLAEFVAKQLEMIGLKIELEMHPSDFLGQIVKQGKVDFFRRSWLADYADPESYLTCFYSKNGSPPNYTQFSNAQFDYLYEKSLSELDEAKRIELYQSMDRILIEEAPIVPLFYDEIVRFTYQNVTGLAPNSINLLDLREVRKK